MSSGNGYVSEDYYNVKVGPFLRKNLTTKEYIDMVLPRRAASMRFLKPMIKMVLPVKSFLFMTEFQRMASVICSYISRNRWAQMRRY